MSSNLELISEIAAARKRLEPHVRKTHLQHSIYYSELTRANVYFKCENLQLTGSFKLRGAMNKYLSLTPEERKRGVVGASTGNHGKAIAYAAKQLGGTCTIFSPDSADTSKLDAIRTTGAEVIISGVDSIEAETAAREFSQKQSRVYISPYNDPLVVAGQGTIGVEICEQLEHVDAVFAAVGGGGLIGGIGTYVKHRFPDCQIVGCAPANSNVMFESLAAGEILDLPSTDTLSDGTAGGIEHGTITLELCKQMTQMVSVSEAEIATSLIQFTKTHGMLIEGAAAVPIAGFLQLQKKFTDSADGLVGKNVVVVLCGANISVEKLESVLKLRDG